MARWMDLRHTYNLKGKLLFSCIGVVCIALGTTVCRVGNVGVDPFTAMNLGLSALVGMDFGTFQLLVNLVILVAVFALDKWQIGLGTIINMVFVGYLIELFTWLYGLLPWQPSGLASAGAHLVIGTLLFTLGVSLYLKTRMGVAPIDAVAPVIVARTRFSYTPVRMAQDILVTVVLDSTEDPEDTETPSFVFGNQRGDTPWANDNADIVNEMPPLDGGGEN